MLTLALHMLTLVYAIAIAGKNIAFANFSAPNKLSY